MQSITQKHEFGCGVACVAFTVGAPYDTVADLLGSAQAATKGFYCQDLVRVLAVYGLNYEHRYVRPAVLPRIFQDGVIVYLKRSALYPAGHYLAYANGMWMDPWTNFAQNRGITEAYSGFVVQLPYNPSYALLPLYNEVTR